jgi:hypothetical protein
MKCLQLDLPLHVLQKAVRAGVERAIELLQRRELSRQSIRAGALALAAQFRAALNAELQRMFDLHGVRIDAAKYFAEHFVHKMGLR